MKRFVRTFLAGVAFILVNGCGPSAKTPAETAAMFQKAGGVDKVAAEARVIFEKFGTKEYRNLTEADLKDFPAISTLGNAFGIYPKDAGSPAHIRIRSGAHDDSKVIFIYDSSEAYQIPHSSSTIKVTPNIFVSS